MNTMHGSTIGRAVTAVLLVSAAACGSDTKGGDEAVKGGDAAVPSGIAGQAGAQNAGGLAQNAGGAGQSAGGAGQNAGGAGQNAGGADQGAGAAGGDLGVLGPSADCTFEIATSGGQVLSYAPELLGCTTLGSGLYALFVREDRTQTEFMALDFEEGQLGVQLAARFQVGKPDVAGWMTGPEGCTVEITEQVLLGPAPYAATAGTGRQYRVTGHGSCTEPAKDPQGGFPDIVTGPFSFRVRKSFYD